MVEGDFNNPIKISGQKIPQTIVTSKGQSDPIQLSSFMLEDVIDAPGYKHLKDCKSLSPLITVILSIFGGFLGLHQFYLGNNTKGITYLLFSIIGSFIAMWGFMIGFLFIIIVEIISVVEGISTLFLPTYKFEEEFVDTALQCYKYIQ